MSAPRQSLGGKGLGTSAEKLLDICAYLRIMGLNRYKQANIYFHGTSESADRERNATRHKICLPAIIRPCRPAKHERRRERKQPRIPAPSPPPPRMGILVPTHIFVRPRPPSAAGPLVFHVTPGGDAFRNGAADGAVHRPHGRGVGCRSRIQSSALKLAPSPSVGAHRGKA